VGPDAELAVPVALGDVGDGRGQAVDVAAFEVARVADE
jgi:hypothetical protein